MGGGGRSLGGGGRLPPLLSLPGTHELSVGKGENQAINFIRPPPSQLLRKGAIDDPLYDHSDTGIIEARNNPKECACGARLVMSSPKKRASSSSSSSSPWSSRSGPARGKGQTLGGDGRKQTVRDAKARQQECVGRGGRGGGARRPPTTVDGCHGPWPAARGPTAVITRPSSSSTVLSRPGQPPPLNVGTPRRSWPCEPPKSGWERTRATTAKGATGTGPTTTGAMTAKGAAAGRVPTATSPRSGDGRARGRGGGRRGGGRRRHRPRRATTRTRG